MVDQIASVVKILGLTPDEMQAISRRMQGQIDELRARIAELTTAFESLNGFIPSQAPYQAGEALPDQPAAPLQEITAAQDASPAPREPLHKIMIRCPSDSGQRTAGKSVNRILCNKCNVAGHCDEYKRRKKEEESGQI